jgi:diguanylate cyclase (GGDEF)-like protein
MLTLLLALLLFAVARTSNGGGMAKLGSWAAFGAALLTLFFSVPTWWRVRCYSKERAGIAGRASTHDALTGLLNRNGLMVELGKFDFTPRELGRRVRLVDVDVSSLKRVNYEYGQTVGDAVLQDLAQELAGAVHGDNLVGRLGGDEFLIVMPQATQAEADAMAESAGRVVGKYRLTLGERGEVRDLKAAISVAAYVPDKASLHETVISAKEATAHGRMPGFDDTMDRTPYFHVPRVTLGAFAAHRWQDMSKSEQDEFKLWKRQLTDIATERMVSDILSVLDERADSNWVDFVTAVPAAGGAGGGRTYAARHLAERIADQLGVPYRDVMRADTSGPENRSIEPAVDAIIEKGDGVLVISDVISSGIIERRCIKKLSAAGAHPQVVAWAAY